MEKMLKKTYEIPKLHLARSSLNTFLTEDPCPALGRTFICWNLSVVDLLKSLIVNFNNSERSEESLRIQDNIGTSSLQLHIVTITIFTSRVNISFGSLFMEKQWQIEFQTKKNYKINLQQKILIIKYFYISPRYKTRDILGKVQLQLYMIGEVY